MRTTTLMLPLYVGMIGTPILLVLRLFAILYSPLLAYPLTVLAAIGFIAFGAAGFVEVFVHDYPKSMRLRIARSKGPAAAERKEANSVRITFRLRRFDEGKKQLVEEAYVHNVDELTTVLGALVDIKEKHDNTLSMRYSCRMGICGSCGMVVNGKPSLACETNVLEHARKGDIVVEPMQGHPLLKDLATDFDDFFEKHMSVQPRLYRIDAKEQYAAKKEYHQTREEVDRFLPYSYCIMCGLCEDACPVVNTNPNFKGPQALAQEYRYYADSRDQLGKKRLLDADRLDGVWGCEFAGACSKVCPKGVDPAAAIQLLKTELMSNTTAEEREPVRHST